MYPAFVYQINDRFEQMPLVLKIVCGATFVLGVFQLFALVFPFLSPRIEGMVIGAPALVLLMGVFHIAIGLGVYTKQKWTIPLIIISPIFQYSVLYLDKGLPSGEAIKTHIAVVGGWVAFFATYFLLGRAKKYFAGYRNA